MHEDEWIIWYMTEWNAKLSQQEQTMIKWQCRLWYDFQEYVHPTRRRTITVGMKLFKDWIIEDYITELREHYNKQAALHY